MSLDVPTGSLDFAWDDRCARPDLHQRKIGSSLRRLRLSGSVFILRERNSRYLEIRDVDSSGRWIDCSKGGSVARSWARDFRFTAIQVISPAIVTVEHDKVRVTLGRDKYGVLVLIDGYLPTRDKTSEGIVESVREGGNRYPRRHTGWTTGYIRSIAHRTIEDRHAHAKAIDHVDGVFVEKDTDCDWRVVNRHIRFRAAVARVVIIAV